METFNAQTWLKSSLPTGLTTKLPATVEHTECDTLPQPLFKCSSFYPQNQKSCYVSLRTREAVKRCPQHISSWVFRTLILPPAFVPLMLSNFCDSDKRLLVTILFFLPLQSQLLRYLLSLVMSSFLFNLHYMSH